VLTNRDGLVEDVKVGGSLGCSDCYIPYMYKQLFSPYNQRNYALTELLSRLFKDLSEAMQKEKKKVFLRLIEKNIN